MLAQKLYNFREEFETFSGQDLHEFFNEQVGDPSPSGYVEIDTDFADKFVSASIEAMAHSSPSMEPLCKVAQAAWRAA